MPLHKTIPLCSFKYVRDTLSSATFAYCEGDISKEESKCVSFSEIREIDINRDVQYLRNEINNINITKKIQYLKNNNQDIDKSKNAPYLMNEIKGINKRINKSLRNSISDISILDSKHLNNEELLINIDNYKELISPSTNIELKTSMQLELNNELVILMNNNMNLSINNISEMIQQRVIDLDCLRVKEITFNSYQELIKVYDPSINKVNSIHVGRDLSDILIETKRRSLYNLYSKNRPFNKSTSIHLGLDSVRTIDKGLKTRLMYRPKSIVLDKSNAKLIYCPKNILLDKKREIDALSRITDLPLTIERDSKLIYISNQRSVDKYHYKNQLSREDCLNLTKDKNQKYFYREAFISLTKDKNKRYFYREDLFHMLKDKNKRYLYRMGLTPIIKDKNKRYLDREVMVQVYKNIENYLDRESLVLVYKGIENYLDHMPVRDIYKELNKDLSRLGETDVYKEYVKCLNNIIIKGIYMEQRKFIDITNRWWWLNSTGPSDKLIVPNNDYAKMHDLLTNDNFEYLRYNNHPIEWGSNWGKDFNTPPHAISIEIMLDLANIITMIWHKNTQGWFNVSGKEAIQLLMELLYDWYSMNTSNPNSSCYRAYRWIRWEAEKVYFLDTKNGLQAIGILVANLRHYLKFHHFNRVPIWRNPKAMDEERNFNRMATNNDLMKELDKNKGDRHYLIETQNFERKIYFRR